MIAASLIVLAGCGCDSAEADEPSLRDAAAFQTDALPGETATLELAGTEIPVEVKRRMEGSITVIELWAHGQVVQQERYEAKGDRFSLQMAGGEQYASPLPLLKFPMDVGESWDWEGKMGTPENLRPAKAKVTTATEQVYAPTPVQAVRVQVDLELESGGPLPAKRTLTFWIVEGRGVVKRQFGSGSSRVPG